MHIFVLKENLVKALSIVNKAISIKPTLPILSNILLKTENNQLKLSATNLELGLVVTLGAKIEQEGEITIPGKLLTEFINSLTTEKIELVLKDNNLIVKTDKTHASFTTSSTSDFPPFPDVPKNGKTFPINKIKEAILRTVFAASNDESRPVLTGIKTIISSGIMSFTATDGYRLSINKVEITDKKENLEIILPATSLLEVIRIAEILKAEEVGFFIIENKNQVVFTLSGVNIFTRVIDGELPNVEKIIPVEFKTKVTIDRDQLFQSVKTTSLFARGAANIVKIKVEKDGLRLSANTPQVGSDEDYVEAKVEGEEMEIAFNYRFLLDLLNNFPEELVIFESSGSLNPGVFKPVNTKQSTIGSFLHLIMPVRVQGE